MKKPLQIIILTRFNLNHDTEQCSKHLDRQWLERRFDIFEQYCLPSVAAQSDEDFEWIVMFDHKTPKEFIERAQHGSTLCKQLRIKLLPFYKNYNDAYAAIGREYISGAEQLVSIRLDNDDALNRHFVELIRHNTPPPNNKTIILTFPHGLQWFTESHALMHVRSVSNHYLTFVEHADDNVITALGCDHSLAKRSFALHKIAVHKPMWLEVVHGLNIANNISIFMLPRPAIQAKCLTDFAISVDINVGFIRNVRFLIPNILSNCTTLARHFIKRLLRA